MKLHKRFAASLTLVTLLGITAAAASAETVLKGSFNLPEQAYWGNTLVPAGEYSLLLNREPSGINIVTVRGEDFAATFMAPGAAREVSERTFLRLDDVNGTYIIRELQAGFLGKSYSFPVSKSVREMTLRGSVAQPVTVSVSANGGM